MKKIFFSIIFAFVCFTGWCQENKKFSVLFNPVNSAYTIGYAFADNTPETFQIVTDVEFQYTITEFLGISLGHILTFDRYLESYKQTVDSIYDKKFALQTEYILDAEIYYLPLCKGFDGPFVSVFPRIGFVGITSDSNSACFMLLGGGINGGYEWQFKNNFILKLYGGISKTGIIPLNNSGNYKLTNKYEFLNLPFDLNLGCKLGFCF